MPCGPLLLYWKVCKVTFMCPSAKFIYLILVNSFIQASPFIRDLKGVHIAILDNLEGPHGT